MALAVNRCYLVDYNTLTKAFDTFRLLADSMDFLNEDGDGWEHFRTLCEFPTKHTDVEKPKQIFYDGWSNCRVLN